MFHGAVVSRAEREALRQIKNIVRLDRVLRIEKDCTTLEHGSVASNADRLYVDCSASAVERRAIVPVFAGHKITPQMVRTFQPNFRGAFIAHIEATVEDGAGKNQLCAVIPMPDKPSMGIALASTRDIRYAHAWRATTQDWRATLDKCTDETTGIYANRNR